MRHWGHALLVVLFLAASVSADTIELKNGRIVDGKYLGGTSASIRFQDKAGKVGVYRVADVVAVSFGDLSEPAAAAAPRQEPRGYPSTPGSTTPRSQETWSSRPGTSTTTPAPPATSSRDLVIPSNTTLRVRTIDDIDSKSAQVGDQFKASLADDLVVDGTTVVRRGADATLKLVREQEAGTISGRGTLTLALTEVRINGQNVSLAASSESVEGRSRSRQSAERIGGGAALGAVIGAIAGGGKGAAIGAIAGAGAGTAVQVLTRGDQVRVPSETVLEFHLEQAVTLHNFRTGASRY